MTSSELDHLLAGWSADQLTSEERTRLEAILLSSAAARERMAAWCTTEVVLRQTLQVNLRDEGTGSHALDAIEAAPEENFGTGRRERVRRSTVRLRRRPRRDIQRRSALGPILAAAAMLCIAIGVIAVRTAPAAPKEAELAVHPVGSNYSVDLRAIATVQAGHSDLVMNGNRATPSAMIPTDTALQLNGNSASIRILEDNSTVSLSERARLRIVDSQTITLDSGVITCSVAPQKSGRFAIRAPFTRVEVVGTLFTVDAGPQSTLVSVVSGVVRVAPNSGGERLLHAGDEVTVNANGFVENQHQRPEGILHFECIDITTGLVVGDPVLPGGTLVVPPELADDFNIRIHGQPEVNVIRLLSKPEPGRLERILPFSIFADTDGVYRAAQLDSGRHTIRVRAYADDAARIALGDACEITVVIP